MVALDATVVATALRGCRRSARGRTSLQWTLDSYGIAFAAGIITAAALATATAAADLRHRLALSPSRQRLRIGPNVSC